MYKKSLVGLLVIAMIASMLVIGCNSKKYNDTQGEESKSKTHQAVEQVALEADVVATPKPKRLKKLEKTLKNMVKGQTGTYSIGVLNLQTGDYAYVNDVQVRAASVIKIFVEAAAFQKVKNGELKLNQKIKLQDRSIERAYGTGVLQSYPAGYEITLKECLKLMMTHSDNRASNIVLDLIGIDYVNEFMKDLGCSKKSSLGYYFYIDGATKSNYLTTRDVNMFFQKLYRGEVVSPKYDKMMIDFMKANTNTTKIVAGLPNGVECAHKTGAITGREHDCGIVYSENGDYVIAVLGELVPNGGTAYANIAKISKAVYEYFN